MADNEAPATASPENVAILAAAAVIAGTTDGNDERLLRAARELKQLSSPGSKVMRSIAEFDGADGDLKHFTGTVLGIMKEQSSTRGVVSIYTGTDHAKWGSLVNPREHPLTKVTTPGVEHFRTDRTDSKTDTIAKDLANRIGKELIGHKVNVTLKMEENKGTKFRTLIAVTDLGVSDDARAVEHLPADKQAAVREAAAKRSQG